MWPRARGERNGGETLGPSPGRGSAPLAVPAAIFVALLISVTFSAPRVTHDVAMYLQAASLMLDGERPYVDFVDLNPPMVMYASAVPVGVARLVGMHVMRAFAIFVCLLAGWAAFSVGRSLARGEGREDGVAAAWAASAVIGFTAWLWFAGDFGQREHLFFLLYVPFFVARTVGVTNGRGFDFARGVVAGIGVCIKPHFPALVLAVEIYLLILGRDLRRLARLDLTGLVAAGVAYVVHFALLPGDVRHAFLERWLPLVTTGYAVYEQPMGQLWGPEWTESALVATAVIASRLFWRSRVANTAAAAAVATLAAAGIYVFQSKGWFYQAIPFLGFRLLTATCVAAGAVGLVFARRPRAGLAVASAVALAALALFVAGTDKPRYIYPEPHNPFRGFLQRYTHEGDRVLFLSTGVTPAYPILTEENRLPGSRFLWMFPVPMFYRGAPAAAAVNGFAYHDESSLAPEEKRFIDDLNHDVAGSPPAMIVTPLDAGCEGCPAGFNLTEYMRRGHVLDGLDAYQYVGDTAGYAVFAHNPG